MVMWSRRHVVEATSPSTTRRHYTLCETTWYQRRVHRPGAAVTSCRSACPRAHRSTSAPRPQRDHSGANRATPQQRPAPGVHAPQARGSRTGRPQPARPQQARPARRRGPPVARPPLADIVGPRLTSATRAQRSRARERSRGRSPRAPAREQARPRRAPSRAEREPTSDAKTQKKKDVKTGTPANEPRGRDPLRYYSTTFTMSRPLWGRLFAPIIDIPAGSGLRRLLGVRAL